MDSRMSYLYHNVIIDYIEKDNQWVFTLRGQECKVESLAKAKEWIDNPFKPVNCIGKIGWSEPFTALTITSIANSGHNKETMVWVTNGKNKERKFLNELYTDCLINKNSISFIASLNRQIEILRYNIDHTIKGMKKVKLEDLTVEQLR